MAQADCWIQVRAGDGSILIERILQEGESWQAPDGAAGLSLRAGNAGGLMVRVDGALHGPLGRSGEVIRAVALSPDAVRERFARVGATPAATAAAVDAETPRREARAAPATTAAPSISTPPARPAE